MARQATSITGGSAATLPEEVFGEERNDPLLHEVVKAEQAARRQGTHSTRTRGLVAGGRSKPWRQKGTGRARAGTIRAAQWTGGGVVFGPTPRSHALKVNRKARAKAVRIALSGHAAAETLATFDAGTFGEPSTKQAAGLVAGWREERPLVVVVAAGEEHAERSFRNLARTEVVGVGELEVGDLLWARSLLVSEAALRALAGEEERS